MSELRDPPVHDLMPEDVAKGLAEGTVLLVDVRELNETAVERYPGAAIVPLSCFDPAQIPDPEGKTVVFGLLERNTTGRKSRVKAAVLAARAGADIKDNLRKMMVWDAKKSTLHTDEFPGYQHAGRQSWGYDGTDGYEHKVINHAEAYAIGNVHTNGMENFWSLLKRTIRGTYVSIEPFHLFRYLDEQAFRFNERGLTDSERFKQVGSAVVGKRLTYRALTGADLPESLAG